MARFELFFGQPQFDWRAALLDAITNGNFTDTGSGLPSVTLKSGDNELIIEGSGFDVTGGRQISGGTVSSVTLKVGTTTVGVMNSFTTVPTGAYLQSKLTSPPADIWSLHDIIAYEPMTIIGSGDPDNLVGSAFDDTIQVTSNDYVRPGLGANAFEYVGETGPQGGFLVAYTDLLGPVSVDLQAGTATGSDSEVSTGLGMVRYIGATHGADTLKGSDYAFEWQAFIGNAGNDEIDGRGGFDFVMYDDEVDYGAASGSGWRNGDRGVVVNLAKGTATDSYGDKDTLKSIEGVIGTRFNDKITGNSKDNMLMGLQANDSMKGAGGKDTLQGGDGKDTLDGGDGKDTINGGNGRDSMTGGADKDVFIFSATAESGASSTKRDIITDFKHGTDDIDLSAIDANTVRNGDQSFTFDREGSANTSVKKGHIGWYQIDKSGKSNDRTIIKINVDDDAKIEMQIELKGLIDLNKGDFIL